MKPEIEALLSGYSVGTLTKEEQDMLLQAAFADQEAFDALAVEQPLRELLSQPSVRRELLSALERPTARSRAIGWAAQPWPWFAAAATVAAVVGVLTLRPAAGPPVPAPTTTTSPALPIPSFEIPGIKTVGGSAAAGSRAGILNRLFALPVRPSFETVLRLDRPGGSPAYRVGDGMRLTFSVERESNVLILEKRGDDTVVQLFPNASVPFPRAKQGVAYSVPSASDPAIPVTGPAGTREIRLVAFPTGTDPMTVSPAQLDLVARKLTVVETSYEVRP